MASMLRCYYDSAEKKNFEALFGDLEIGKDPTGNRNRYQVLYMDFSEAKIGSESVFNSDRVLYHLSALVKTGTSPDNMVDVNIKTDYDKLQTIAEIQHRLTGGGEGVLPVTEEIASTGQIAFDLVESFPADKIPEAENFRSLFHYYGILSMAGREMGKTIVFQFKGSELVRLEQIAEEQMAVCC